VTTKTSSRKSDPKNSVDNAPSLSATDAVYPISSKIGDNVLPVLTMAQLIGSKLKVDPKIPRRLWKQNLQCEKIKDKILQTVETLPVSKDRIERVLAQPEFEIVCSTPERIHKENEGEAKAIFNWAEKKYISKVKCRSVVLVMNLSMQTIISAIEKILMRCIPGIIWHLSIL
jgi:hypothetical protein